MLNKTQSAPRTAEASHFENYSQRLSDLLKVQDWSGATELADELFDCWKTGRQVFIIGNGGAGGSAVHLANDLMYPISKRRGSGIRVQALLANPAILTCLGNLSEVMKRAGCRVPDHVAVAATSLLDGHFDAGVDQNSVEVGRVAMATLAGLIHQNERGIPQYCRRILVEGRWVDGACLPDCQLT